MTAFDDRHITRRDFIYVATGTAGAIGAALAVWPLIDQMNPDASVTALSSIDVEFSTVEVGASVTVKWRGRPVFIRHRSQQEIGTARGVDVDHLIDRFARNPLLPGNAPATDENRAQRPAWVIVIGICTHLGCVPIAYEGDYDGYFCPCHGSLCYTAGRVLGDRRRKTCICRRSNFYPTRKFGSAELCAEVELRGYPGGVIDVHQRNWAWETLDGGPRLSCVQPK